MAMPAENASFGHMLAAMATGQLRACSPGMPGAVAMVGTATT